MTGKTIPQPGKAAGVLSPETLFGLQEYYDSAAMMVTTDKGDYDPSKQRAKWFKDCFKEAPDVTEYCISRFLWHYHNATTKLDNWRDLQFIVGLLQYEDPASPSLTRDQEVALIRVTRAIYGARGAAGFTRKYGVELVGTWTISEGIGRYTLKHPEHAEGICRVIRDRGLIEGSELESLLNSTGHHLLVEGAL